MQRTDAEVESLVREHGRLVQYEVNRYLRRYAVRGMERDDLVSWGMLGLVQAARMWDLERGAFSTVACRAIGWMLQRGVGRERRLDQGIALLSLDDLLRSEEPGSGHERFVERLATDQHVEQDHLVSAMQAAVRSAVAALPGVERLLIQRHFFEDVPVTRVAAELGVSRQNVSEKQRKALRRLRALLDTPVAKIPLLPSYTSRLT